MTKLPKILAAYSPIAPPPALFIYQCRYCKYFIEPNDCSVVCRKKYPDYNIISPTAWCVFWNNKPEENPLDWIKQQGTQQF